MTWQQFLVSLSTESGGPEEDQGGVGKERREIMRQNRKKRKMWLGILVCGSLKKKN